MFLKLLALGTVGAFLGVILKKYSRELVIFLEIAVAVIAVIIVKDNLFSTLSDFGKVFSSFYAGAEIFKAVFKASAVTVMAKLGAEVCRESSIGLMGDIVELGGRVMLIILAFPFIEKVTEIALAFVK
ncbi:MAG: hypothetical protein IJ349_03525 [Clostridia bacterium]|nr:hypothetical protein [Clostridia bacterium]